MFAQLERHPNARAVLGPALSPGGRASHAYLFYGPGGSGKSSAAELVASELLAGGVEDPASARARVKARSHPDLTWVTPSGAHEILVADIDQPVVAAASKTPFEAGCRVFVIEGADQLGDEAANRMLKTLEEPASFVHLILLTERLGDVLPTIRSRCQLVRFDPAPVEEIAAELEAGGVAHETALACARLAMGDARRARELSSAEGHALRLAARALALAVLGGDGSSSPLVAALLDAVRSRAQHQGEELAERAAAELELHSKRERKRVETEWNERLRRARRRVETQTLDLALSLIAAWLLDTVFIAWGADDLVRNVDGLELLSGGPACAPERLRAGVELIEQTRLGFQLNVTPELACEALAYRLEETLAA